MSLINELPSELLARAFEIGIFKWGIQFLPPLRLTCQSWNEIVLFTPRLFGIIDVTRVSRSTIQRQLARAKAAPLYVTIPRYLNRYHGAELETILLTTAENWVYAAVPMRVMYKIHPRRRDDLTRLDALHVAAGDPKLAAASESFWGATAPPKLRFFSADGLCSREVHSLIVVPSSIIDFELKNLHGGRRLEHDYYCQRDIPMKELLGILARIPNAARICLDTIQSLQPAAEPLLALTFSHLTELDLTRVRWAPHFLASMNLPALQNLVIVDCEMAPRWGGSWQVVFMQWSQPGWLPVNLQSIDIRGSLEESDVDAFIRWLARLPNVVRLMHDEDARITAALAYDASLCPGVVHLAIERAYEFADLMLLAKHRRARLKFISAALCFEGSEDEIAELKNLVEEVHCVCFSCGFDVGLTV
ncbi:hypothetical protein CPB85DRAFT_1327710 [Mucidula mucida]|nr:hypothetical protein CPB85DRAFT_1327710 [Mucidula mucida]